MGILSGIRAIERTGRCRASMVKSVVEKEKSAMKGRLKVLHVALEKGNYELAAHALVYGMVKASIEMKDRVKNNNGEKG